MLEKEEGSDDGIINKSNIRSELSFYVTCQAYMATKHIISEHQQAFSELLDQLDVDNDGTST